jgi:hypothetical protein
VKDYDNAVIEAARVEYMDCLSNAPTPYPFPGCPGCILRPVCDAVDTREKARHEIRIKEGASKGGVNDPPRSRRPSDRPQGDKPPAPIAPGDPICKASCPCCGASLDITHGDDEGEISVVGIALVPKSRPPRRPPPGERFYKEIEENYR